MEILQLNCDYVPSTIILPMMGDVPSFLTFVFFR